MLSNNNLPANPNPLSSLVKSAKNRSKKTSQNKERVANRMQSLYASLSLTKSHFQLKKAFVTFSALQDNLSLKKNTMFLSFQIYAHTQGKIQPSENCHSNLQLISQHLAAKYQQIYPPMFLCLQKTMGVKIDLQNYRRLELYALQILNYNLNFSLISREVQQQMGESNYTQSMIAAYLLQISIVTPFIYYKFPRELIVKGVTMLAKYKESQLINEEINNVAKHLLLAKANILKIQPSIFYKYQQRKYGSVAISSF